MGALMSLVSRWEDKFLKVERAIEEMSKVAAQMPDAAISNTTIRDRDQIDRALAQISEDTAKTTQGARKVDGESRPNAAIAYWSKQLAGKIKVVAEEYVALQNRKMWLRVLQVRFLGQSDRDSVDLHATHLVDIASRKRALAEHEATLRREMRSAARERDVLKFEYEGLAAADQNWEASGSFQSRLGKNLEHSRSNPSANAFSECLFIISVPNCFPEDSRWIRKANRALKEKSEALSAQGRKMASELAKGSGIADKLSIGSFRSALEQVEAMDIKLQKKWEYLRGLNRQQSRPKLVQNHGKKDNTNT